MISVRKIFVFSLLVSMIFSFSGCSIRKAGKSAAHNKVISEPQQTNDTDNDGLNDGEEKKLGTDPNKSDTDNDGLSDYDEVETWNTDPNKPDTDGDGYSDGAEVAAGYDPKTLGQLDSDRDGLGSAYEIKIGTDPYKFDTDDDGLSDKEEVEMQRDPLTAGK